MKVLLVAINAKFSHTNPAVRSIAAYLIQHGHEAEFLEFTINMDLGTQVRTIAHHDTQQGQDRRLVLFSTYIWNVSEVKAMVSDLKKVRPNWLFGVGGPEVSFDGVGLLQQDFEGADFILCGEGEELVLELVEALKNDPSACNGLDHIKGLVYRDQQGVAQWQGVRPLMADISRLPFVYQFNEDLTHRIIYYESSRGCPFNCSYCLSSTLDGVRYRPVDQVCADLQIFLDAGAMQVKFVDRTFNADQNRALAIMKYLAERDNGKTNFHFEMTATMLDEATMAFVESVRPSLFQFEIGVQTTNAETGVSISRNMSFEKIKEYCQRLLRSGNVHLHLDLIAGLPYETYERFKQSIDDVMSIHPHMLQLGFLKMLKGSKIRNEADLHEYRFTDRAPYEVLSNKYISYDQMTNIKEMEELLEFYFNSGLLRHTTVLTAAIYFNNSYGAFLEDFSRYWTEYGLFLKNHKKEGLISVFVEYLNQHAALKNQIPDYIAKRLAELASFEGVRFGLRTLAAGLQLTGVDHRDEIHNYFRDSDQVALFNPKWVGKAARDLVKNVVVVEMYSNPNVLLANDYERDIASKLQHLESLNSEGGDAALYAFDYSARDLVTGCYAFQRL